MPGLILKHILRIYLNEVTACCLPFLPNTGQEPNSMISRSDLELCEILSSWVWMGSKYQCPIWRNIPHIAYPLRVKIQKMVVLRTLAKQIPAQHIIFSYTERLNNLSWNSSSEIKIIILIMIVGSEVVSVCTQGIR